jgi:hypothetical protein
VQRQQRATNPEAVLEAPTRLVRDSSTKRQSFQYFLQTFTLPDDTLFKEL